MFNKTDNILHLVFLKSSSVKTFPSGRRRSPGIDKDANTDTASKYYIPFDPEARLNTEANSRKYSSLNGYTQTYLKSWDKDANDAKGQLLLSLGGYLFNIELSYINNTDNPPAMVSLTEPSDFATEITSRLETSDAEAIYANIILEDVKLYSSSTGLPEYYTSILRDQPSYLSQSPSQCLDLLNSDTATDHEYMENFENYYFSGLSFSTIPLIANNGDEYELKTRYSEPYTFNRGTDNNPIIVNQQIISLCILKKIEGEWQIHQPAYLPKIEHGETNDSIVVTGDTTIKGTIIATEEFPDTEKVNANINKATVALANLQEANIESGNVVNSKNIYQDGYKVPIIELVDSDEAGFYQLKISRIGEKLQN